MKTCDETLKIQMKSHDDNVAISGGAEALFNRLNETSITFDLEEIYCLVGEKRFAAVVVNALQKCRETSDDGGWYFVRIRRAFWNNVEEDIKSGGIFSGIDAVLALLKIDGIFCNEASFFLKTWDCSNFTDGDLQQILAKILEKAKEFPWLLTSVLSIVKSLKNVANANELIGQMLKVSVDRNNRAEALAIYKNLIAKMDKEAADFVTVLQLQNTELIFGSKACDLMNAYVAKASYEANFHEYYYFLRKITIFGHELSLKQKLRILNKSVRTIKTEKDVREFLVLLRSVKIEKSKGGKIDRYLVQILFRLFKHFPKMKDVIEAEIVFFQPSCGRFLKECYKHKVLCFNDRKIASA